MTLTITIEGKGVIANADAETNDTGGTGTGDWGFDGSGGVSWGLTTDTFLYGSSSMAMALSGSGKNGWMYFDRGAGNELDFDVAGAEEGQHIYVWINCPTIGLSETLANVGVGVRIGSSTSDFRTFTIAGNDDANGWDGGWVCLVIDPTKAGSISDTGSPDVGAIRYIGIKGETTATAKGDNFFIDQIAVGFGLRISGTSTNGWEEAVTYCTDYVNRAWGMLQEREGIYYAYGKFWIGDSTQTAAVSFTDTGRVIQFGISEYWTGSVWATAADIDYSGIIIEDASAYPTTYQDGTLVGSDAGRSGSTIIGNTNHDVSLDWYGGSEATSLTKLYGTSFRNISGAINFGDDPDHHMYSVAWENCAQVDPVGAIRTRNCLFVGYTADPNAALLWNANIDIRDSQFIANTDGINDPHAIEHPDAGSFDYYGLNFSGNDYDINFSAASGDLIIGNQPGSNASTYEITGGGSTVTINTAVTLKLTVKDRLNQPIQDVQCAIYKTSDDTQLMNEDTLVTGIAEESFNYPGSTVDIYIRIRKSSTGTRYYPIFTTGVIDGNGYSLSVLLAEDPFA